MSKNIRSVVLASKRVFEPMILQVQTTGSSVGDRTASVRFAGTNVTIDWGDGFSQTVTTAFGGSSSSTYNRVYASEGTYNVILTGNMTRYGNDASPFAVSARHPNQQRIKKCLQWGLPSLTSLENAFNECSNLEEVPDFLPPNVTNLSGTFFTSNANLTGPENWGSSTSQITDMSFMFGRRTLGSGFNRDISAWDVSNVTNMGGMFVFNSAFNNGGSGSINNWDTSNVTNTEEMFRNAQVFNQPIGSWDTSNVTSMQNMFQEAFAFNQDVSTWDVSSVVNMSGMFLRSSSFNQPIGSWDVSNVINMLGMFQQSNAFNQDLSGWDVSSVRDMNGMFRNNSSFNQPLGSWDVSKVETMNSMFLNATAFNQPIGSWDVSSVTDMRNMFRSNNSFNQPLGSWDVTGVSQANMANMFDGATVYNQDLSTWCVEHIATEPSNFSRNTPSWTLPKPNWGAPCP